MLSIKTARQVGACSFRERRAAAETAEILHVVLQFCIGTSVCIAFNSFEIWNKKRTMKDRVTETSCQQDHTRYFDLF